MSDTGSVSGGYKINPALVLSGADLIKESQSMAVETFDLGDGMAVQRQGMMIKFTGDHSRLSPGAMTAALQAMEMGGEAGRAMFETFRRNNPEDFDGSQSLDAVFDRMEARVARHEAQANSGARETEWVGDGETYDATESPDAVSISAGNDTEIKGSAKDDFLEALNQARIWGQAGNDTIRVGNNAWVDGGDGDDEVNAKDGAQVWGGAGNDTIRAGGNAWVDGGNGDDVVNAMNGAQVWGGAGNDTIRVGGNAWVDGGDGDDVVNAMNGAQVWGGAGNDTIGVGNDGWVDAGDGDDRVSAYHNATVNGGAGNDRVTGYDNATVADGAGHNYIDVYANAQITAGAGNDWITAYSDSTIDAGDGNNYVSAYERSSITTGRDADMIKASYESVVVSGGGNDKITVGKRSTVDAGTGDDEITVDSESVIRFNLGDGNDVIAGGKRGYAFTETNRLSSSTIAFGEGISASDLAFEPQGNDLVIRIPESGDSLTIADYQRHGIPSLSFSDGSVLTSSDVSAAVGPGEDYQATSQVLQNWRDANTAYQTAQTKAENGATPPGGTTASTSA